MEEDKSEELPEAVSEELPNDELLELKWEKVAAEEAIEKKTAGENRKNPHGNL